MCGGALSFQLQPSLQCVFDHQHICYSVWHFGSYCILCFCFFGCSRRGRLVSISSAVRVFLQFFFYLLQLFYVLFFLFQQLIFTFSKIRFRADNSEISNIYYYFGATCYYLVYFFSRLCSLVGWQPHPMTANG